MSEYDAFLKGTVTEQPSMSTAYIGIGSNLGDRQRNVDAAVRLLSEETSVKVLAQSKWYNSPALTHDGSQQPDYLNGVIKIETSLEPEQLLDACQSIEQQLGRPAKHGKWETRTIDLDILLYDDHVINTSRLTIPHPEIAKRGFVLEPLYDIAPELKGRL